MELRSYNVERVYKDCVKCCIGEDLGVNKEQLAQHTEDIKDMCSQIAVYKGWTLLATANIRKDGEIWTPYLQIVEMLIRMGKRIGILEYTGNLKADTIILLKEHCGLQWVESCEDLPLCDKEYSTFPTSVFTSVPCKAVSDDNRIIVAVYVIAVSVTICNDGSRTKWEGWTEKTGEADDFSCVEGIFEGKTINVLRWRYPAGIHKPTQKIYEKIIKNKPIKV